MFSSRSFFPKLKQRKNLLQTAKGHLIQAVCKAWDLQKIIKITFRQNDEEPFKENTEVPKWVTKWATICTIDISRIVVYLP